MEEDSVRIGSISDEGHPWDRTRPDGRTIPDEKILAAWGDRTGPPELQDHLGSP